MSNFSYFMKANKKVKERIWTVLFPLFAMAYLKRLR